MVPSFSSPSSSSSKSSPPHRHSPQFTPIQEELEDELSEVQIQSRATPSGCTDKSLTPKHHPPTPLHGTENNGKSNLKKKRSQSDGSVDGEDGSVSCNKCRPHAREKISVVPLDNNGLNKQSSFIASPNGIFKSIFSSLTRKSPKLAEATSTVREEQWKIAVAEISHKLIQATRKRDEAILEASRLKYSMAELERKLNKLELYCHNLKSGLEECSNNSPYKMSKTQKFHQVNHQNSIIEHFLVAVAEARTSVRLLSRALTSQLRHIGAFFEDFESVGFQKSAPNQILNPMDRCEANFASFNVLNGLTWEEVLNKGTRYFSEDFSRFCDRKMSEIVAMLGWNRAWPEPLLQSFFGASKSVWVVHLLANSLHPSLPIFRVDKGVAYDSVYMEDMGGDKASKLVPNVVRIMVTPGFYVYGSVVKCKVLCRYSANNPREVKGLTVSPWVSINLRFFFAFVDSKQPIVIGRRGTDIEVWTTMLFLDSDSSSYGGD
ncbi:IRK-interacting protein [Quillaja saponaria]|uniref:IRK-interacting protein n=1 Tax=Quillaja saponaria TaxID=32244 RepID=A0AAD7KS92_QUISA|nr:IRK-interacting protein [Quillaja saponaria]